MDRSIALSGLKQVSNHLGVLFKFFRTGFSVWSDGVCVILLLSEATQQGSPLVERTDCGPESPLQAIRMIRQQTVGRIGMSHMTSKLEGRPGLCFP